MSATLWSKFFWSDWQADEALRACSLAARGLWMEMLCIAVHNGGYLARDREPLPVPALASIVGQPLKTVETLLAELERNHVFSRDRRTRIYSRRMVRELKLRAAAQKVGKRGGNPTLCNANGKTQTLKGGDNRGVAPISQKPESISQPPKASGPVSDRTAPAALPIAAMVRVAEVMGTSLEALQKKQQWMVFGDTFAGWLAEGCDAECDVWPTIAARMAKRGRRGVPDSPNYFRDAVREARDERLAGLNAAASAAPQAPWVSPEEWQTRLDVFKTIGAWSHRWGPKPGDEGCLAPEPAPEAEQ